VARARRLIHGDTNPEGPGYKEEEIAKTSDKLYPGRPQSIPDDTWSFWSPRQCAISSLH